MNLSPHHYFPDFTVLMKRIESFRPTINTEYDRLLQIIPGCSRSDARLLAIGHIGMLLDSTYLAFSFLSKSLLPVDNPWWVSQGSYPFPVVNSYNRSILANNFNNGMIKIGFIQNLFSILDSRFRIFLRELDPEAASNATVEFLSVYQALKKRLPSFSVDSDTLIDLLRLARNTIHNNGVYFHPNMKDRRITYKGEAYDFLAGQPITFVNWEWLLDRLEDTYYLMKAIVNAPQLISIQHKVVDPFSQDRP